MTCSDTIFFHCTFPLSVLLTIPFWYRATFSQMVWTDENLVSNQDCHYRVGCLTNYYATETLSAWKDNLPNQSYSFLTSAYLKSVFYKEKFAEPFGKQFKGNFFCCLVNHFNLFEGQKF